MRVFCINLMLIGFCLISVTGNTAQWVKYGTWADGSSIYYYDKDSIAIDGYYSVKAWTKIEATPEAKAASRSKMQESKTAAEERYKNFSHVLNLYQYDCLNLKASNLISATYDDSGKVTDYVTAEMTGGKRWFDIHPDTSGGNVYRILCAMAKEAYSANKKKP